MRLSIERQADASHVAGAALLVTFAGTGIDAGELATWLAGVMRSADVPAFTVQAVTHQPALVAGWPASITSDT